MTNATQQQQYGATYTLEDGEITITNVFPVSPDWDGYRFHGYCRPTEEEIKAAGYEVEVPEGVEVLGKAPNGQTMYRWTEPDGSAWEEYWQTVPGGGLVLSRQVSE